MGKEHRQQCYRKSNAIAIIYTDYYYNDITRCTIIYEFGAHRLWDKKLVIIE